MTWIRWPKLAAARLASTPPCAYLMHPCIPPQAARVSPKTSRITDLLATAVAECVRLIEHERDCLSQLGAAGGLRQQLSEPVGAEFGSVRCEAAQVGTRPWVAKAEPDRERLNMPLDGQPCAPTLVSFQNA